MQRSETASMKARLDRARSLERLGERRRQRSLRLLRRELDLQGDEAAPVLRERLARLEVEKPGERHLARLRRLRLEAVARAKAARSEAERTHDAAGTAPHDRRIAALEAKLAQLDQDEADRARRPELEAALAAARSAAETELAAAESALTAAREASEAALVTRTERAERRRLAREQTLAGDRVVRAKRALREVA